MTLHSLEAAERCADIATERHCSASCVVMYEQLPGACAAILSAGEPGLGGERCRTEAMLVWAHASVFVCYAALGVLGTPLARRLAARRTWNVELVALQAGGFGR